MQFNNVKNEVAVEQKLNGVVDTANVDVLPFSDTK